MRAMTLPRVLGLGLMLALLMAGVALLWQGDAGRVLAAWAAGWQLEFRNALAVALRALRAGEPGAMLGLVGLAFGYGVAHAAGPGHGKMLIGGYGLASGAAARKLLALALVSSLAQAAVAVAVVYGGVTVLGLGRDQITGMADAVLNRLGAGMMVLLGLWILWRGARHLRQARALAGADHDAGHAVHEHHHHHGDHHHHHAGATVHGHSGDDACGCGHSHGPTPAQVAAVTGWREMALLVAGIAMRPCSGALILLVLCWRMGLHGPGIAAAFAMGLGTALVTSVAALAARATRAGGLTLLAGQTAARVLPLVEIAVGLAIVVVATRLVLPL